MIWTGDLLDAVGNTHIIIVFSHTTVIMEVKPRMEVTCTMPIRCGSLSV